MLFNINLNKLEDKSEVIKKMTRQGYGLILISAVMIAITAITAFRYSALASKRKEFTQTIVSLKDQIKELEQGENYIGEDQVMDLYDLTNERIFWSEKLEALADLVDTNIAITSLNYQREKLYIKGITLVRNDENRFETISAFIDSLNAAPVFSSDFNRIEFSSSDRTKYRNRNIVNFEIVCLRNQEY